MARSYEERAELGRSIIRTVKSDSTTPELEIRTLLRQAKLKYRLNYKSLPGKPDIVLLGRKIAVFIHGCFWHSHDCRAGQNRPKRNADYWFQKLERNRQRDSENLTKLSSMRWRVFVVWECEVKREGLKQRLLDFIQVSSESGRNKMPLVDTTLKDKANLGCALLVPDLARNP